MPVYIDVSAAVHQRAGLARYASRIARTMISEHHGAFSFALFHNGADSCSRLAGLGPVPRRSVPMGSKPWRMMVWLSHLAGVGLDRLVPGVELFHSTEHLLMPLRSAPTVMTVHDLAFKLYPAYHRRLNRWFLNSAMPLFLERATAIITVSESSKRDLMRVYGVPADKITVTYEAASPTFSPAPAERVAAVRSAYGLPERYLLTVGTIEPRKNLIRLVQALQILRRSDPDLTLVIVGGAGWLYQDFFELLEKLEEPRSVLLSGFLPDEDLPAVMSGAEALVMPSLYEGFGLPVLEAMACGTPVVSSSASSLPELGGQAARYFDPHDAAQMASVIQTVLADQGLRHEMRRLGMAQAASFSWERTVRETLAVYQRVLGRPA